MDKNNLINLRNHLKYAPYNLAVVKQTGTIVELVSYPYIEEGKGIFVKARTTIGDPTTMVDFLVTNLTTPEEGIRTLSAAAKRMMNCTKPTQPVFNQMTGEGIEHIVTVLKAWMNYSVRRVEEINREGADNQ